MKAKQALLRVAVMACTFGAITSCAQDDAGIHSPGAELAEKFQNPPEETKPWCYWYWLNSDITKDGISKDLEAMAEVGIKRAMIGNIEGGGTVKMFSPEWYDAVHHAFKEANRVGVELMMFNGPGWSQSGGPWIKPEQSMRRVSWNEFDAHGGTFSRKIRPDNIDNSQDIAVLAVPKIDAVSIIGEKRTGNELSELSLNEAFWIWYPSSDAAVSAPAGVCYFKRKINVDTTDLSSAKITLSADNSYVLAINGKEVLKDGNWQTFESASIKKYLKSGENTITLAVTNSDVSPAGLIAALELKDKAGKVRRFFTDESWLASMNDSEWVTAGILGRMGMAPWDLSSSEKHSGLQYFGHTKPFAARALVIYGKAKSKLYALKGGNRELIADIETGESNPMTDFWPDGIETFSFKEVTAKEFELVPDPDCRVVLTSEPMVAQVIEKQMGRMHPTPSPVWESYIFPDTVEPDDVSTVIRKENIIDLTDKLDSGGVLTCTLPNGNWRIIYFGMVTTGVKNSPAPPEATGLECDKMSRKHTEYHFNSMFTKLLENMSEEEKATFKGITIDSYEKGSQNWTDGFAEEFARRNGYNPISLLPVMTGRVVDSAETSDKFLWDLRRTAAEMIAENYVGGLRDIAHEHGMSLWLENYGHWGFPAEFLSYGGQSDEIGGEFWSTGNLGTIECRAASSAAHIYGKRRVYAEAFTSSLDLGHHPYTFKARGEELFCEGINHFVLHVYAHQPRDGMPGKNPWFGTAFHRNTPWFNQSRDWVKYLQRCHYMLQQGDPVADVAVYIGDFAPQMTGPANPLPPGYDYDYIGSDAILRTLHVVDGEWVVYDEHNPKRIAARYKLLAMPDVQYIRPQVLKRLEALMKQGGKIINSVPVTAEALQKAGILPVVSDTSCSIRWKARQLEDGMMFFLSNFQKPGIFETALRVTGKAPELFNPVSGQITKLARYKGEKNVTRISIDVKDTSDSFFIIFRNKQSKSSVVDVTTETGSVSPADLDLFFDQNNMLTAETPKSGIYNIVMSDGAKRTLVIEQDAQIFAIESPWQVERKDEKGYSALHETTFVLPVAFGKGQRIVLDLGSVSIMAKVTLNGNAFDTLWMPPFTLDVTDAIKSGTNKLQVLVTSTSKGQPALGKVVRLMTRTRKIVGD